MALPIVRRNTFMKSESKTYVDILSKVFLYCELLIGINRFAITCENRILIALFHVYSLITNIFVCYVTLNSPTLSFLLLPVRILRVIQYETSAVLSLFIWRRFYCFYKKMEKFDNEIGCRPKFSLESTKLIIACVTVIVVSFIIVPQFQTYSVPLYIGISLEYFYFGHLVNLIITRMRVLNYYMECSTSIAKMESSPKTTEFNFFGNDTRRFSSLEMGQILELYQIIITAHKFLVDAVKWLMLTTVVTSFIYFLIASYCAILWTIDPSDAFEMDSRIIPVIINYLLLFVPCMSSDRLREEVCRFRELLSSSLYGSQLDRSSRSATRTLLALTETRNLSISLLGIIDISASLPFSFLGLIVTYLIILVQFRKVIFAE